jgi:hypothetical protein
LLRHVFHPLLPGGFLLGTHSLRLLLTGMGCAFPSSLVNPLLEFRLFYSLLANLCCFDLTAQCFVALGFLPCQEFFLLSQNLGRSRAFFLEGVIGKKANSPYPRGRTPNWVKVKTKHGRHIDEERAKWNE